MISLAIFILEFRVISIQYGGHQQTGQSILKSLSAGCRGFEVQFLRCDNIMLCNFMWFNCDILMCNFCDEVYSCFYKVIQCDLHVLLSPWFVCAILVMTSYYLYEIWCDVHMCFCHNKIKFSLKFSHIYNMLKRWQHHEKNVRLSREK